MASTIIPHGCQFHADTFQQCVTIHTCIVVNSYIKEQQKETNPKQIEAAFVVCCLNHFVLDFGTYFVLPFDINASIWRGGV